MTVPAEDPRGGEAWTGPTAEQVDADPCGLHDFWCDFPKCVGSCNCHLSRDDIPCPNAPRPPAAGRGDTDSGGEGDCFDVCQGHPTGDKRATDGGMRDYFDAQTAELLGDTARPAGDRAQPTQEASSNDVAVEDVRAISVALGLGRHARPYSAHDLVHREIVPAVAALLDAQAAVSRVRDAVTKAGPMMPRAAVRRALDGTW